MREGVFAQVETLKDKESVERIYGKVQGNVPDAKQFEEQMRERMETEKKMLMERKE